MSSFCYFRNICFFFIQYRLIVEENSEEETVKKALQKVIPEVQLARYYGKEMSFILPSDSSPHFPSLFKQLDQRISNGSEGIEGYGVSMTTLEEVSN